MIQIIINPTLPSFGGKNREKGKITDKKVKN